MKRISIILTILVLSAVCVYAASTFGDTAVDAYSKGANADYLAGAHMKLDFDCSDCHGETAYPGADLKANNEACESCHTDLHGMAELSAAKFPGKEINAHESHLT